MMKMELRMDQYDRVCDRCGDEYSSSQECGSCRIENASLQALRGQTVFDRIDENDRDRNQRRRNNGLESPQDFLDEADK